MEYIYIYIYFPKMLDGCNALHVTLNIYKMLTKE